MSRKRLSPTASLDERFAAGLPAALNPADCWEWQRGIMTVGYGAVSIGGGRSTYAHRLAYELHVGPIPDGREIHHTCRNRACVNPAHLEAVTHSEHVQRDKRQPQRDTCKRGHDLTDPDNVYAYDGRRWCKPCAQAKNRRWMRQKYGYKNPYIDDELDLETAA
jgi:hypothetical protein